MEGNNCLQITQICTDFVLELGVCFVGVYCVLCDWGLGASD